MSGTDILEAIKTIHPTIRAPSIKCTSRSTNSNPLVERLAVGLVDELPNPLVVSYLNRLSDFLFVAARYVNKSLNGKELPLNTDV